MGLINWFTTAETNVVNFIKGEIAKISGDVAKVAIVVNDAPTIADNLVNALKAEVETPTGKTILSIVETVVPAPWVNAVLTFLPTLVTGLNLVKSEFTSWEQEGLVKEAISTAVNAATPDIKASNLITLQAHINTQLTAAMGAPLSIQGSMSQAPAVHIANAAVATNFVAPGPNSPNGGAAQ